MAFGTSAAASRLVGPYPAVERPLCPSARRSARSGPRPGRLGFAASTVVHVGERHAFDGIVRRFNDKGAPIGGCADQL